MCSWALKINIPDCGQHPCYCRLGHRHTAATPQPQHLGAGTHEATTCPAPCQMPGTPHSPAKYLPIRPTALMLASLPECKESQEHQYHLSSSHARVSEPFPVPSQLHIQRPGTPRIPGLLLLWRIKVAPLSPSGLGEALGQPFSCVIWRFLPGSSTGAAVSAPPLSMFLCH